MDFILACYVQVTQVTRELTRNSRTLWGHEQMVSVFQIWTSKPAPRLIMIFQASGQGKPRIEFSSSREDNVTARDYAD